MSFLLFAEADSLRKNVTCGENGKRENFLGNFHGKKYTMTARTKC